MWSEIFLNLNVIVILHIFTNFHWHCTLRLRCLHFYTCWFLECVHYELVGDIFTFREYCTFQVYLTEQCCSNKDDRKLFILGFILYWCCIILTETWNRIFVKKCYKLMYMYSYMWLSVSYDFNPLKPSGNYIYHRFLQSVTLHVAFTDLVRFSV
jgi:hypothetical protein